MQSTPRGEKTAISFNFYDSDFLGEESVVNTLDSRVILVTLRYGEYSSSTPITQFSCIISFYYHQ